MGFASEDGYVTEANLGFYEAIAKGGVGLIVVEHGFVDYPMGVTGLRRIAISHDKFIPGVSKLAQAIHRHDTPCFIQLGHSGSTQRWLLAPGQLPVSSSSLGDSGPRELSIAEIEELVKKYAKAAERAKEAGFDGVEIHAAHPLE
jgi:2,4-dienoyl-CoA reductase-like NADH-dependent reductase (Old Yellow Enzyme family)